MQVKRRSTLASREFLSVSLLSLVLVSLIGCSTEPVLLDTGSNPLLATTGHDPRPVTGPFGNYNFLFRLKINQRFHQILKDEPPVSQKPGKVVLTFSLWFNGTITGLRITDNEVGEQFASSCKRAVEDSAPFAPWPPEMKKYVGRPYQDVRMTFTFNK